MGSSVPDRLTSNLGGRSLTPIRMRMPKKKRISSSVVSAHNRPPCTTAYAFVHVAMSAKKLRPRTASRSLVLVHRRGCHAEVQISHGMEEWASPSTNPVVDIHGLDDPYPCHALGHALAHKLLCCMCWVRVVLLCHTIHLNSTREAYQAPEIAKEKFICHIVLRDLLSMINCISYKIIK